MNDGTTASAPTDDEIEEAYAHAMRQAEKAGRKWPAFAERAVDSATDAVLWARANFDATKAGPGGFPALAAVIVKRALKCARIAHARRAVGDATEFPLRDSEPIARQSSGNAAAKFIDDLPDDLAFAAFLYSSCGYNLRDCGLLMGCSANTVQVKLHRAAELLAPGGVRPARRNGEKRLARG